MRQKSSKYKGVSKFRNKWRARFLNHTIGIYKTELQAALAYNKVSSHKNQLAGEIRCCKCREIKPKSEFQQDNRKITGVSSCCRKCHSVSAAINKKLEREKLNKNRESLIYLKNIRILKLIETNTITKNDGRNLYDNETAYGCFSIRIKKRTAQNALP